MKQSYLNSERNSALSIKPSIAIRLLMVLFVCLFGNAVNAAVIITKPNLSIPVCSSFPSSYYVLGDIIINENNNGDFASDAASKTIILSAPANFEFKPSTGTIAFRATRDISAALIVVSASMITITYTCTTTGSSDRLTISGLEVRAITAVSSGEITRTAGTGTISGLVTNTTLTNTLTSTISAQPTATAGGSQTICSNSTVSVSGASSSNGTIAWTENGAGSITSGATTLSPVYTPSAGDAGKTVTLTMTVLNGCGVATATYTVIVNALPSTPTSVTSSATSICSGSSIDLKATSTGSTIYWYTVSTGGSPIGTSVSGANFTLVPTTSTKYYAEARSALGCPSASRVATTKTITVSALPVITVQPIAPASVCAGSGTRTISVTVSGTTPTYQWRKNGVNLTNSAPYTNVTTSTLTITNPSISENGAIFDVVVTRSSCPVTSTPATLTVNPSPIATITGANGVCIGSSTQLTAATPGGTWSSNSAVATVSSSGLVTGLSAGNATITYSLSANGCTGTDTHVINVSSAPSPLITFNQGSHDITQSITACGQVGGGGQNDLDIFSGNPTTGSPTYQWQLSIDNGVSWVNAEGPTSTKTQYVLDPFYTTFTSNAGTYKFRLIISNNGCSGISDSISLIVTGVSALVAGTISGNQSSCDPNLNPIGFTSSAPAGGLGGTYTYQWQSSTDGVNFTSITGATSVAFDSPAITQTTYFRRSVKSGGCSAISNVLSVLVGAPIASASQPNCASSTGTITVPYPVSGVTYTITGTNPITAPVTNSTGIFSGLPSGVYNVVFNAAACISLPTSVTVNTQPAVPSIPVTSIAQPCGVSTGIITVIVQNASDTYSFDNGVTFQESNIKSGLSPGSYNVIIKNSVGCISPTKLIIINSNPSIPSAPIITSVIHPNCAVSTGTITVTIQNANDIYSFDNGISFQSSNIKSGLSVGSYDVIIQSAGGCNSTSKLVVINAQPEVPLAPILTETIPTCVLQTGTITIAGVSGETYSFDGSAYTSNLIYSGLAQGSLHTFSAMNAGGCISPDATISITSLTNTWANGVWSLDTPTAEQNIVFTEDYNTLALPITTDIEACSCRVTSGSVTIDSENTMTLTNELIVDPAGTLTFESSLGSLGAISPSSSSASLVQKNSNAVNSGKIIYKRIVPAIHDTDYTYWSSPVSNVKLESFSPLTPTDKFYIFNGAGDNWANVSAENTMSEANGYCVYGPANSTNSDFSTSFKGVPNNGQISIKGVESAKSYLIGNPYPSAIDADRFILANINVIDGSLYFWTHNTDPNNGKYTYDDYATYNLTGGTGTLKAPSSSKSNNSFINANTPNGYIGAGQGFFVGTKDPINQTTIIDLGLNNIVFDNSMRVGGGSLGVNNSNFFKTTGNSKGKTASSIEKNRVWLNLSNGEGVFKQTLVGYITGASNDYETAYDADSYDSLDGADFYSVNKDSNLVIQGRALPFDENDTVPLGFRSSIDGEFTINIDQVDGLLANQSVYVEDKLTNTVTDLKSGDYKFSTVAGTFNDRFVLKYTNTSNSLSLATDEVDGIMVFYSNNYNTLIIHNSVLDLAVNSVDLYNMAGQNISNWDVKDNDQTNIQIPIKEISSGIYIVKVKTTKGESNKKIIVN